MTEQYTPTTEEVRLEYMAVRWGKNDTVSFEARAEFDRWLAERDAEVAAKALEDAAEQFEGGTVEYDEIKYASSAPLGWTDDCVHAAVMNSAPVMDWLRARADEYRKAVQS